MMAYSPLRGDGSCAPLAIISHGAGGSENGYSYLALALAQQGYKAIVVGHRESGRAQVLNEMRDKGIGGGLRDLVMNPEAESSRLLDIGAALKWADSRCKPPFRVLLGHSMGAITVMLESGAKNEIGVKSPPAGQDRFDAYVALSPEGPGLVFPERAWTGIHKPMLLMTGTRDQSLKGGPEARQIPFRDLQGTAAHCQWLAVIEGATHMNFAGAGIGAQQVTPIVTETVGVFLQGVRSGNCALPPDRSGLKLQAK